MAGRQSEAGLLSPLLGRVERLEETGLYLLASSRLAHYAGGAIQVQDVLRTIPSDLVVFDRSPRGHRDPWLDVEPAYRHGEL